MPDTAATNMPVLHLTEDARGISHLPNPFAALRDEAFAPPATATHVCMEDDARR
jgi:hypothetical protein